MEYIIEIINQNNQYSFDASEINLPINDILVSKLYLIEGDITKEKLNKCISLLFQDPVTDRSKIYPADKKIETVKFSKTQKFAKWEVEVFYKKEVTDPATSHILKALTDIDISIKNVRTGNRYVIDGTLNYEEALVFSKRYLANLIVQNIYLKKL